MEDIILKNGIIVDGTGSPAYSGGIAVANGVLTAIGNVNSLEAKKTIDVRGRIISPGFIDIHSHSDLSFLVDEMNESKIYQGITTEVSGNCGHGYYPSRPERTKDLTDAQSISQDVEYASESFDAFLGKVERNRRKMSTNLVQLIGHGALRSGVMGNADRKPDDEELKEMKRLLARDLEAGAWGLSLGLEYAPGCFSSPQELEELGKVTAEYGGLITAHMRNEGVEIENAIDEIISINRFSGVRVHISHLKLDKSSMWGQSRRIWDRISSAAASGIPLTADMYPYEASSTVLTIRCPQWSLEGGMDAPAQLLLTGRRQEIIDHLAGVYPDRLSAERCLIITTNGIVLEAEKKNLHEAAEALSLPYAEAAAELIVRTKGQVSCVFFVMDPADVEFFLSQDISICTDSSTSGSHPRKYGSLARFLRLRREKNFCSLEEAIRRITGKSAGILGIKGRGVLKAGYAADVAVFDEHTIADAALYTDPFRKAEGISTVIVNGALAMENGVQTAERAGKFLKHKKSIS